MLVLSRRPGQKIEVDGPCTVTLVEICGDAARLGFDAESSVTILRDDARDRQSRHGAEEPPGPELCYLASPYRSWNLADRVARFNAVRQWAGRLLRAGVLVLPPLAHTITIADGFDVAPTSRAWQRWDTTILRRCDRLIVLQLPGWTTSRGVEAEIREADRIGMPVHYLDPQLHEDVSSWLQNQGIFTPPPESAA